MSEEIKQEISLEEELENQIPVEESDEDYGEEIEEGYPDILPQEEDQSIADVNPVEISEQQTDAPTIQEIVNYYDTTVINYLCLLRPDLDRQAIIIPIYRTALAFVGKLVSPQTAYSEVTKVASIYAQRMIAQLEFEEE